MRIRSLAVALVGVSLAVGSAAAAAPRQDSRGVTVAAPEKPASAKATPSDTSAGSKKDDKSTEKPGAGANAAAKAKEPAKPVPTGLERLSDDWPAWLRVGIQYRGRAEATRTMTPVDAPYDSYYLNRFRLKAAAKLSPWLSATFEAQDSQVLAYSGPSTPKSLYDAVDLRQANVEIATKISGASLLVRAGRQEMAFGEGRLIASADWGNTNRTWDVARVGIAKGDLKIDVFGGSVVQIQPGFNDQLSGERLYGAYAALGRIVPRVSVEPYVFVRTIRTGVSELGAKGDTTVYTFGSRATVKPSNSTELVVEAAVQRGHQASDSIGAWAQHSAFVWKPARMAWKPQFTVEFNNASGDANATDGRRGTFDQLYASMHGKFGLADRIAWRNMRHAGVSGVFAPARKLTVGVGVHYLGVATLTDAYYGSNGSKAAFNKTATSKHVGWETDGSLTWNVSKELALTSGVGVLWVGDYLQATTQADRLYTPYLMWTMKF